MSENLTHQFPKAYLNSWNSVLDLSRELLSCSIVPMKAEFWPILALGRKAASTTSGIWELAKLELWADAMVLTRSLFEVEMTIKWLLKGDVNQRIGTYLSGIEQERNRFIKKLAAGLSISAQVFAHLTPPEELQNDSSVVAGPTWSGLTIRELARETDLEGNYDIAYWISSAFAHAHALSILEFDPNQDQQNNIFRSLFSQREKGFLNTVIMEGVPCQFLHILDSVNRGLHLSWEEKIEASWREVHSSLNKGRGVTYVSSSEVSEEVRSADFSILSSDGAATSFSYKRSARLRKRRGRKK